MKCEAVRDYFIRYASGTLAAGLLEQVGAHLRNCPACRAHCAGEERLAHFLAAEQSALPPEAFWANFLPRVRDRIAVREKKRKVFLVRRWVYATAGVAGLLALSYFAYQRWFLPGQPADWVSQLPPGLTAQDIAGYVAERGGDGQLATAAVGADSTYIAGLVAAAQEALVQEGGLEWVFHQVPDEEAERILTEVERLKL